MKSKAVGKKAGATGKKNGKHGSSKGSKSATDESGAPAKSLDQFLETWSDDDEDESGDEKVESGSEKDGGEEEGSSSEDDDNPDDEDEGESDLEAEDKSQRDYLKNLDKEDPEFYKFLQEEGDDALINPQQDDSSRSEDDDSSEGDEEESHAKADDVDSEDEGDDQKGDSSTDKLAETLQKNPSVQVVAQVVKAFRIAVENISGSSDGDHDENAEEKSAKKGNKKKKESVKKPSIKSDHGDRFNALLKLCIAHLPSALEKLLGAGQKQQGSKKKKALTSSKNWTKMNKPLKSYTADLVKVTSAIASSESVLSALLKHIHALIEYFAALPKSAKTLLKTLVGLWSSHKDDKVRVLAYMCILKLGNLKKEAHSADDDSESSDQFLEMVMKQMYMAYIRNVKFTSPSTWPNINFMRRSLAEMFLLDQNLCYKYAFVYIRQLTIHLRNAMVQNKQSKQSGNKDQQTTASKKKSKKGSKDTVQSVYNWQFVHSVHLWCQLLQDSHPSDALEPLIYPLIQLINGAIKLVYSSAFFPLRFHLARLLTQLSASTGRYAPVLPYYLDILRTFDFSKKTKKVSMKPMNFSCILRLSKSQMTENVYKDAVVEQVYAGILENVASNANLIAFPEVAVPLVSQLRTFVKTCQVSNYTKKVKQLLDKINENSKVVLERRRKIRDFGVQDLDRIAAWQIELKSSGVLPLVKYFESWKAINEKNVMKNMAKEETQNIHDGFETTKLPSDASDSEDESCSDFTDDDDEPPPSKKAKNQVSEAKEEKSSSKKPEQSPKKKEKSKTKKENDKTQEASDDEEDAGDEVTDFNMDDFGGAEEEEDNDETVESDEQSGDSSEDDGGDESADDSDSS